MFRNRPLIGRFFAGGQRATVDRGRDPSCGSPARGETNRVALDPAVEAAWLSLIDEE